MTGREVLYDDHLVRPKAKPSKRDIVLGIFVLLLMTAIAVLVVTSLISDGEWLIVVIIFLYLGYLFLKRKHSRLRIFDDEIVITNWLGHKKRYSVELTKVILQVKSGDTVIYEFCREDGTRICYYLDPVNQKSVYGDSAWELALRALPFATCEGILGENDEKHEPFLSPL